MLDERSQFRALYRHSLRRLIDPELLSVDGEPRNLLGRLVAVLAAFSLVYSLVRVPVIALATPAERQSAPWGDPDFLLTATMASVGLLVLLAWDRLLPDPKDALILGLTPVRVRTVFLAKLAAIASGMALAVFAVNCFSGLAYPLTMEGGPVRALLAYWFTTSIAGLAVCASVLSLECLLALVLRRRAFLIVSGPIQLLGFVVIAGYCLWKPAFPNAAEIGEPANQALMGLLPTFWFVGLLESLQGAQHEALASLASRGAHAALGALLTAAAAYPLAFAKQFRRVVEQPDVAIRKCAFFESAAVRAVRDRLVPKPLRQAVMLFVVRTLARSRQHRLVLACYLGLGAAYALAYPANLWRQGDATDWLEPNVPMLAASLIMLVLTVVGLRAAFSLPLALESNWIFRIASVHRPPRYFEAVRASVRRLVAPVLFVSAATYLAAWPGRPAILHIVLMTLIAIALIHATFQRFHKAPFACSFLPDESASAASWGAYVIGFVFLVDATARLELWSVQRFDRFVPAVVLLVGVVLWARRRTLAYDRSPASRVQFEAFAAPAVNALDMHRDGPWSEADVEAIDAGPALASRLRTAGVVLLLLVGSGVAYERFGQWRDESRYPQIGRSIDIGGRTLNIHCIGEGVPTVIFEAGHAAPGVGWSHVQREVARFTRACWYDRAGRGWSEPGPDQHHADSIAADLHRLLRTAGEQPPYALVGTSLAGFYVRVFTDLYREEVAGLVLVDPDHEDADRPEASKTQRLALLAAARVLGRLGFFRLREPVPGPAEGGLTEQEWDTLISLGYRYENQLANIKSSPVRPSAELARAAGGLEDLPLVVLSPVGSSRGRFWESQQEDPRSARRTAPWIFNRDSQLDRA